MNMKNLLRLLKIIRLLIEIAERFADWALSIFSQ